VRTIDGPRTVEVRKPVRLCVPASVRGEDTGAPKHPVDLLCFDARLARVEGESRPAPSALLATRNGFGNEVLKVGTSRALCVPAARADVPVPTPTPFPTITPPPTPTPTSTPVRTPRPPRVRIEPSSTTALVRDRVCFAAFLELDDTVVDVSASALWNVADGAVAVASGFDGTKKCFVGIGIGTTAMTARDGGTGVTSAPASFKAEWPIFQLTVSPKQMGMRPGDATNLTVTAKLAGGRTRNVTQQVRYEAIDPAVARLPNAPGNRSRVEAAALGATSIVVSDNLSSLSDAASVVVGDLLAIQVDQPTLLFPGETAALQATGLFSAGFTSNLTQTASYESSDPSVAVALNIPGDRSRVQGVTPGRTTITAIDPVTGIRSTCCGTISVLGAAEGLVISPSSASFRIGVGGDALAFRASGSFAIPPFDSAARVVTDYVTWTLDPPGIVSLGVVGTDQRLRLTPIAGGETRLTATDPQSGRTAEATVTIFDHLQRIDVGDVRADPTALDERSIPVGGSWHYYAHGYFDGDVHTVLNDARFVASDPSVVEFFGGIVRGLHPGTVVISAIDQPTGLSSDAAGGRSALLTVYGDVDRIALQPASVFLDVGESRSLTALGYRGSEPVLFTQRVEYFSSDPNVVVATNQNGNRSRIVAVGPGTATISAFDPGTGLTSTESNDDTVVTVQQEDPIVSVEVTPRTRRLAAGGLTRVTAIAHLTSGATENVTQRVTWSVSDPAVASAPNIDGDRSRIDAIAPGAVTVSAFDPASSLSSSDSGADATLTVVALASLTLSPATVELDAGEAFSLTTVGTATDGSSINVTQDVTYVSSDPNVVVATNLTGNKSRIEAVAPGVATIRALRPSAYPQATDSNTITVTVSP
jgi:hypothetical protein